MTKITLIAAQDRHGCIGADNTIPWHVPEDFAFFKHYTLGKPVLMGRQTWDSLPKKPLPGRDNWIITRQSSFFAPSAFVAHSLQEALDANDGQPEICIIGGASIYAQAIPMATDIVLTTLEINVKGDAFFPQMDANWTLMRQSQHLSTTGIGYKIEFFSRQGLN